MKPTTSRQHKAPLLPIGWREAEYAALQVNAADTCDDRVSEDIFDVEDEWAAVGVIAERLNRVTG
jgi:hypothetical protein